MSIRDATFNLCKLIPTLPKQLEVRDALLELNNTRLGFSGDRQMAQVYGFLILDDERTELAKPPSNMILEPLKDETRVKLKKYQSEVFEINRRCVKRLTDMRPNCSEKVLSPYNRFNTINIPNFTEFEYFETEAVTSLVNAFQKHPLLQLAIDSSYVFNATFSPEHYIHQIIHIQEEILTESIEKVPERIEEISRREQRISPIWMQMQHLLAVLGLRGSLGVINELIYEKLFLNQLPCFDEEDIIKFGVYAFGTGGSKLLIQENGLSALLHPGEIAVVKGVPPNEHETYFCRIERLNSKWLPGEVTYVEFRTLDQHLNPYGILSQQFTWQ